MSKLTTINDTGQILKDSWYTSTFLPFMNKMIQDKLILKDHQYTSTFLPSVTKLFHILQLH